MHEPDSHDLARFGYKPELERSLGSFSAFAAGFSYISILTGLFQMFHLGYQAGGPAFFWTWPTVFVGQLLVALCFAELAAHYPLSGGVYQWSKCVGSGAVGWMAGWAYLASLVITLAAVALALQITLPQIWPGFQLVGQAGDPTDFARNAVLLGCVLIALTTLINAFGVRLMAKINNVGVFTELAGVCLLIVLLAGRIVRGPSVVFETHGRADGGAFGYLGPFLAASLTASYVMYGFDTAGSLAEETHQPRRKAPRAILQALLAAAGAGALLLLFALMATGDLGAPELGQDTGGLPWLVTQTLGGTLGKVFLGDVIFAISVCALAVHAGTVRVMFAMARDHNLPFSVPLARIAITTRTPVVPAVVIGAGGALILVVNALDVGLLDLVAPIAILWANLAYLLVTAPLLVRRLRGWPGKQAVPGRFSLGRWGLPINVLAVVWSVLLLVNLGWPRSAEPGTSWYAQYGALLFTGLLVVGGGLYYGLVQRHKTGVLPEHRANPFGGDVRP